jgi:FtsP/CotA-like multicopper oxidase with cupredoxin domain
MTLRCIQTPRCVLLLLLLVQRKPKWVDQYTHKAARYAAEQAAKTSQDHTATTTATATTATPSNGAVNPSHYLNKPPSFSSIYYSNPVPDSCAPLRPGYAADVRDASLTASRYPPSRVKATNVNFSGYNNADGMGVTCTVNNELFAFPDPNPLVMEMGEVVQWTTDNAHSHPLHTHTQPFQLTAFNLSNMYPGTALTSFFQVGACCRCSDGSLGC